ncbi:ATP phosphoribosyltransferase regulatory subunit [Sabulicella glaciei]|uniref:ATP phosphoribosyltransferase regulatory subunit n=1 Tax=Sabulicella glaciei TaxID=2984948 RepID=A0ABT3NRN4_9PROT|nr:ATP phosphoribosyltransferase regulatory subunit [Roseococcus sp. MDT2-1-1]MCW8084817.1 ATP phosphoribosyltransferase regulatory subunit [Roseococcus sp. MDT2-1-1]
MSEAPNPALLPAGLMDLLPPEAEREAVLVEALMESFARHGYERVTPPLLEFEEGLLAGSGAAVAEQTFRLMDPVSQRMMGLRADMTPQVARLAATRLAGQGRPLRLCYAGQVLRVRGSELAPARQLRQAGIEMIGGAAPEADAEVALVAVEAVSRLGIQGISLDVGLPRMAQALIEAAGIIEPLAGRLARALDRKDAADVAAMVEGRGPIAALLPEFLAAAGPAREAVAALDPARLPESARPIAENALSVVRAIAARAPGLRITLDPVEFRGFQYHVGVAFTLFGPGMTGELARGGRYLAAHDEPATGMTLYADAVLRAAPDGARRRRCFLPMGTPAEAGERLREAGFATVAALSATDTAAALRCTHEWDGEAAIPLKTTETV